MKCDFCGAVEAHWEYPCDEFVVTFGEEEDFASGGDWAACETCADLIDRGLGADLAVRVLHAWLDAGMPQPAIDHAGEIVQAFFDRRRGSGRAIG